MLDLCLTDSNILYFWRVLEFIHKLTRERHVLQCLFVRGSNKKQWRGRIISNFTKGETLIIFYDNQVFLGIISQCDHPSYTFQKIFTLYSPLQLGQEENIRGYSIERGAYWFVLKIAKMFPLPTSSNRMINTFIIVNITPTFKR